MINFWPCAAHFIVSGLGRGASRPTLSLYVVLPMLWKIQDPVITNMAVLKNPVVTDTYMSTVYCVHISLYLRYHWKQPLVKWSLNLLINDEKYFCSVPVNTDICKTGKTFTGKRNFIALAPNVFRSRMTQAHNFLFLLYPTFVHICDCTLRFLSSSSLLQLIVI